MKVKAIAATALMASALVGICGLPAAGELAAAAADTAFSHDFSTEITIVDKTTDLNQPISPNTEETYLPEDRIWQGCPNILVTQRRIWATWYSGGTTEPRADNYCVVVYSEDGGKTWVDPYMIIDPVDDSVQTVLPLFMLYENEMWIIWYDYGAPSGTYAIKSSNYDAENIAEVSWTEPKKMFDRMIHHRPTELSDGTLIVGSLGGDKTVTYAERSINKGETWQTYGKAKSDVNSYKKAKIVEKRDGTLWMLSQLEQGAGGGMEQSFSSDGGKTWTKYEHDLTPPLISPGARFEITRLRSGNLAFVSYATTNARTDLTVYLSEDDGATWPYSVLLDDRTEVSYPDLSEDEDGNIYVIWDMGRYLQKEMRISIMTEANIKAGRVRFENEKIIVSRLSGYRDIVSVENVERTMRVALGTTSASIIKTLPASIEIKDDTGTTVSINGRWASKGYKADTAGVYNLTFIPTSLGLLQDVHNLLRVEVTIVGDDDDDGAGGGTTKSGCRSTIGGAAVGTFALLAGSAAGLALRRRTKK